MKLMPLALGLLLFLLPAGEANAAMEVEREMAWVRLRQSTSAAMFQTGEVARLEAESLLGRVQALTPEGYNVDALLQDFSSAAESISSNTRDAVERLKPELESLEVYLDEAATSVTEKATSITREKVRWAEQEYEKRRPEIDAAVSELKTHADELGSRVTSGTLDVLGDIKRGWESGGEKVQKESVPAKE